MSMKYLSIKSTLSQIIYLNWKSLWTMHSIFPEWRWKLLIGCNAQCPLSPYSKRSEWKWQFQIWSQNERGNISFSYESAKYQVLVFKHIYYSYKPSWKRYVIKQSMNLIRWSLNNFLWFLGSQFLHSSVVIFLWLCQKHL